MEPQWIREPQGRMGTGHWPNHSPLDCEDVKKNLHPNSRLLWLSHCKYDCSYNVFANGSSLGLRLIMQRKIWRPVEGYRWKLSVCVYGNQAAFTLPDQMMDGHTVSLAQIEYRTAALFQP